MLRTARREGGELGQLLLLGLHERAYQVEEERVWAYTAEWAKARSSKAMLGQRGEKEHMLGLVVGGEMGPREREGRQEDGPAWAR